MAHQVHAPMMGPIVGQKEMIAALENREVRHMSLLDERMDSSPGLVQYECHVAVKRYTRASV